MSPEENKAFNSKVHGWAFPNRQARDGHDHGHHPHRGGKFVEHWLEQDTLGLLQQLGVVPAPGQAR